ncbi:MAG: PPC domain-containing protein [Gemmatales bacterium]|nr:PPC domain-containing protein [Gemmatales bacterium]MDW8388475.1 PPC domain-containing protein [Gemmatales bacterium]
MIGLYSLARQSRFLGWLTVLAWTLTALSPSQAQPPTVNPAAPVLNQPFPMGIQRGTTLDLTLSGSNLNDPVQLLTSFPAAITIPTDNNNGKDAGKLLVRLDVPKDAPPGWHTIRLATVHGVSNFRLFCIDDLPQIIEENNNARESAQSVPIPCVVCGRTDAEKSDFYKISVSAGQRLSFEILGRRLGSQLDPMIRLIDPRSGKPIIWSDDAPGLSKDARFSFTFKDAGEYLLEVRDVRYQGGGDWFYRLRIGDFPLAVTPMPLAIRRGTTAQVGFAGPAVQGIPPVSVSAPTDPGVQTMWLSPIRPETGLPGWPVALTISDFEELVEQEPNDEPNQANRVPLPGAVSGKLEKKYDRDHFVFAGKKNQRVLIDAVTQEVHSPSVVYLVLRNAQGNQIAASNPTADPARIDITLPEDGDYTLAVEHLHYWGGPEETYRIVFNLYEPDYVLTAQLDRHDAPAGGMVPVHVTANRRDYGGPIDITVSGPQGVSGNAVIQAGQTSTLVPVRVPGELAIGGHRLVVTGKAKIGEKEVVKKAHVRPVVREALGNLAHPPAHLGEEIVLGVTKPPPFSVQATYEQPEALRGGTVPVAITLTKAEGFDEEVTIALVSPAPVQGQQPPIPPVNIKIPKGQNQGRLELKPAGNAPLGPQYLAFSARGKYQNRDFVAYSVPDPLPIVLPFDLQVEARGGELQPAGLRISGPVLSPYLVADLLAGTFAPFSTAALDLSAVQPTRSKLAIKVKAKRRGGYNGPIALEVRNLPANVTATKPTLAEGQNEVEIELTAPSNAAVGAKGDVHVLGTATGLGNQQNASANFTITVVK